MAQATVGNEEMQILLDTLCDSYSHFRKLNVNVFQKI